MEAAATGDRATATDEASTIPAQHMTAGSARTHHRAFCVHGDISAASDAICRDLSDDDNIDKGDNVDTNHKRVKETTKTLHRRTVTIYTAKDTVSLAEESTICRVREPLHWKRPKQQRLLKSHKVNAL